MRLLLLVAAILTQPAFADAVTVSFSGQISALTYADCQTVENGSCSWTYTDITTTDFLEGSSISVGQAFTGSLRYDSTTPMSAVSDDGFQGIYYNVLAESIFNSSSLNLPNASISFTGSDIAVVNGRNGYDALSINAYYGNADFFANMQSILVDSTGAVFSSFALPTNLNMASFGDNAFKLAFVRNSDGDQIQISGALSSITITSAVPVPAAVWLFGSGLVGLAGFGRRKSFWPKGS